MTDRPNQLFTPTDAYTQAIIGQEDLLASGILINVASESYFRAYPITLNYDWRLARTTCTDVVAEDNCDQEYLYIANQASTL